ncbi:hypothetical protein PVAG01_08130 [Phlyctema vagabunda]|uniref:Uncharacterized protein n=1 Tax=Phlyctema vagabunda TaxID=108571 RepID=A0ABR4P8Y2_9HELO
MMSAFSRGCFQRYLASFEHAGSTYAFTPKASPGPRLFNALRFISSSTTKTKKPSSANISRYRSSTPKQNAAVRSTPETKLTTYQSYAALIAQKSHPTLLYQAPSHFLYYFACYGGATFCFAYTAWNFESSVMNPPPGINEYVPIAFGGICLLMASLGGYLLFGPARLIKTIRAVPQKALTGGGQPALKIEVELRKMFPVPFFPARKLVVSPAEVQLPRAFAQIETRKSAALLHAERKAEEQRVKADLEYERSHVMTRPFRHMKYGAGECFRALRQSWTREGFWAVRVAGQRYKLDASRGWSLEGGKPMERLMTVDKTLL